MDKKIICLQSIPFYLFFAHCSRCKAVPQRFLVTNHLKYLGEDMALAFANRSALYFRQKKFQSSLSDTRLALKCGYPKHLKYKVLQRQAKCLYELGHFKDAKHSYRHKIKLSLYTLRMTGTKCFVLSQRKRKSVTVSIKKILLLFILFREFRDAISFMNFCKLNKDQKQNVLNDIQSSMDEIQVKFQNYQLLS